MPTYRPTGVSMHLGAASLTDSTTRDVAFRKQEATTKSDAAEHQLQRSEQLDETNVRFPGDESGYKVNFLKNVPFMQVESLWPANDVANIPKALSLHVSLADKAFFACSFDGKSHHVKVDVFFNGILCSSSLAHVRDKPTRAEFMRLIFSGTRVDVLSERPWIVLPPKSSTNTRILQTHNMVTPQERWKELCDALTKEAADRGINKWHERPPSADYLMSLATMQMPEDVMRMQDRSSRNFGLVDVVITAGSGHKNKHYLRSPARLEDQRYKREGGGDLVQDDSNTSTLGEASIIAQSTDDQADSEPRRDQQEAPPFRTRGSFPPSQTAQVEPYHNLMPESGPMAYPRHLAQRLGIGPMAPPNAMNSAQICDSFSNAQTGPGTGRRGAYTPSTTVNPNDIFRDPFSPSSNALPERNNQLPFGLLSGLPPPSTTSGFPTSNLRASPPVQPDPRGPGFFIPSPFPQSTTPRPVNPKLRPVGPVRYYGPLPEIGMYSVSNVKPNPDPGFIDPNQPRPSILVSRIVIMGKRGRRLVDHRWAVPQRVAVRARVEVGGEAPRQEEETGRGQGTRRRRRSSVLNSTAKSRSKTDIQSPILDGAHPRNVPLVPDAERIGQLDTSVTRDSLSIITVPDPGPKYDNVPSGINNDVPPSSGSTGTGETPANHDSQNTSRRTSAAVSILGLQGPKANIYIFDNPEELLRRQKREARQKGRASGSGTPTDPTTIPTMPGTGVEAPTRSTPLPSNPTPEGNASSHPIALSSAPVTAAPTLSNALFPAQPQYHPPHTPASFSPFSQSQSQTSTPAMTSAPASWARPHVHRTTDINADSPSGKRRRLNPGPSVDLTPTSTAAPTSFSIRNPTLSSTTNINPSQPSQAQQPQSSSSRIPPPTSNPPLNTNSVLCFAEEDEDGRAVLRQIKGEKSGVFEEDMVVCGCRFFLRG